MSFRGRGYLVTGATGEIGSVLVRKLSDEGALVAASDVAVERLRALEAFPGVLCLGGELAVPGEPSRLVEAAEQALPSLDGLIHCVAQGERVGVLPCDPALWSRTLATNLDATFGLCQAAGRTFATRGRGVILVLTSGAGVTPHTGNLPQNVCDGGIIGLIRAAAVDLAPLGVRANVLIPGPTDATWVRGLADAAEPALAARTGFERPGDPREIANAAMFLLSERARYMTGAVFCADGGFFRSSLRF